MEDEVEQLSFWGPSALHDDSFLPRVPLCPSVSPSANVTPRRALALRRPDSPGSPKLSSNQILAPSVGSMNDPTRRKNFGKPMGFRGSRLNRPSSSPMLGLGSPSNASTPSMRKALSELCLDMPEGKALGPKTPRSQRGAVRRASKVSIQYPKYVVTTKIRVLTGCSSAGPSKPPVPSHLIRPGSAPAGKMVTWADELNTLGSPQMQRSKKLLQALFLLRRAGRSDDSDSKDVSGDPPEETLMCSTLRDLEDTAASLSQIEGTLEISKEPVQDSGGARHASALIASRTLLAVQRKRGLLALLEERIQAVSQAQDQRQEFLQRTLTGPTQVPAALQGSRRFAVSLVHPDGDPADADKSNFEHFASTFGLPAKHKLVVRLKHLADQAADWWANEALAAAEAGANSDAIRRVLAVAVGINGDKGCEAVKECNAIIADRMAREVLVFAKKVQQRDTDTVARSAQPQPASAKEAAKEIDDQIGEARALGAPTKHADMVAAKGIANFLAQEEKNRYALKALKFAEEAKARDMAAADAAGGLPEVGPASELADAIEREIKCAVSLGAPKEHSALHKAQKIAKRLRDEDGVRKRMVARQKRLEGKE